jgi:hypothetical protein
MAVVITTAILFCGEVMPGTKVKIGLPVLARLMLSDMAERNGKCDEDFLIDLIRKAAMDDLQVQPVARNVDEQEVKNAGDT